MSAMGQKRTFPKQKDRLAAVSPNPISQKPHPKVQTDRFACNVAQQA